MATCESPSGGSRTISEPLWVTDQATGAVKVAPLDVVISRKLGAPDQPELAIGAVISSGRRLLDEGAVRYLDVPQEYVEHETRRQLAEIERRLTVYRAGRPAVDLGGKTVIVVDDGIATGYTIRAALAGLRSEEVARLVVAVVTGSPQSMSRPESVLYFCRRARMADSLGVVSRGSRPALMLSKSS